MNIIEIIMLIVGLVAGVFVSKPIWTAQANKQANVLRRMRDAEATNEAMRDVNDAIADNPDDPDDARKRLSDWHRRQ